MGMTMDWTAVLREFGLPGLAILYLLWTVSQKDKRIDDLVDRQRADAEKAITAMERMSAALQANTDLIRERRGGGHAQ